MRSLFAVVHSFFGLVNSFSVLFCVVCEACEVCMSALCGLCGLSVLFWFGAFVF